MFYRIRRALRAARTAFRSPSPKLHGNNWGANDHAHICLAYRLLETDDFSEVCPIKGTKIPEWEDACDRCSYLTIVRFLKTRDGKHIFFDSLPGRDAIDNRRRL